MAQTAHNTLTKKCDLEAVCMALNRAKREDMRVLAWSEIKSQKKLLEISIRTVRRLKTEFEIMPLKRDVSEITNMIDGKGCINIYIPDLGMMFNAKLKKEISAGVLLLLEIPEVHANIERRKHLRLIFSGGLSAKTIFYKSRGQSFEKAILFDRPSADIGAGGMSLMVTAEESKFFQVGDEIVGLTVCYDDTQIHASGIVKSLIPMEPNSEIGLNYKAWKIGVEFKSINKDDVGRIQSFVFANTSFTEVKAS